MDASPDNLSSGSAFFDYSPTSFGGIIFYLRSKLKCRIALNTRLRDIRVDFSRYCNSHGSAITLSLNKMRGSSWIAGPVYLYSHHLAQKACFVSRYKLGEVCQLSHGSALNLLGLLSTIHPEQTTATCKSNDVPMPWDPKHSESMELPARTSWHTCGAWYCLRPIRNSDMR